MLLALLAIVIVLFVVLPLVGLAIWTLVSIAVVGLIIGGLARLVLPGAQNVGIVATVLLGWLGSLIGGFLGNHVAHTGWLLTVLLEIAVAAVLIGIYSASGRRGITTGNRSALR